VRGTTASYDEVAAIYYQRGLLDRAHDYSNRSLRLDPARAAAHERLARIWRDWSTPHLALVDAHRAVYYAPRSAAARREYTAAIALDDRAAYAYNNLRYLSFLEGQNDRACSSAESRSKCRRN
jgi:tetratricopeptide (TPR) repeat protein